MTLRLATSTLRSRLFDALRRGRVRRQTRRPAAAQISGVSQPLEDRTMLTAYVVDSLADDPVTAGPVADGNLTLREVLIAANSDAAFGDAAAGTGLDSVSFSVGGTIDLEQGELTISDDLVLDGSGITVDGNDARVLAIEGGTVRMNGLTITGGVAGSGAGVLMTGGRLAGDDLTITGNVADGSTVDGSDTTGGGGGGMYIDGGTVRLLNSSITNNSATGESGSGGGVFANTGQFVAVFTDISGNDANRAGGGIETGTALTYLRAGTLNDNAAGLDDGANPGNGGGLHVTGAATVTILDMDVSGNTAASEGGGLWNQAGTRMFVRGMTTITGNTASGDAADTGGGGIYNNGGSLTVLGADISGNTADGESGSGGGLFSTDGDVIVRDTTFSANTANRAGGGIEIIDGDLRIFTSTLDANVAGGDAANPGSGGALHVSGSAGVDIRTTQVTNNTASAEGGGLWNASGSTMRVLADTLIVDNTASGDDADQGGGGLYNDGGTLFVVDSRIESNDADGDLGSGGGILTVDGLLRVRDSVITLNAAHRAGGGIEAVEGTLLIDGVSFGEQSDDGSGTVSEGNRTGPDAVMQGDPDDDSDNGGSGPGNGGGIHITGSASSTITNSSFFGNTAAAEGGGLWNSATATMRVTDTTVVENVASGDDADQGGGGLFNDGGRLLIEGGRLDFNTADGESGSGGGILSTANTLFVRDTEIKGNLANRAGGGIEIITGRAIFRDVTLGTEDAESGDGNVAGRDDEGNPGNGGGLHVSGAANTTFFGGLVGYNEALIEGGGLWNAVGGIMRLNGTDVIGNVARGDAVGEGGGGIYDDGGRLFITGGTIADNQATGTSGSGGGLLVPTGETTIDETFIVGNTAVRAGGGIETNTGTIRLNNVILGVEGDGNSVGDDGGNPGNGGGLHTTGAASVILDAATVAGNFASNEGGGLWFAEDTDARFFNQVTVQANTTDGDGGGVYNKGGFNAAAAFITDNEAQGSGGGVFTDDTGTSVLSRATIAGNLPDDTAGPGDVS